MVFCIEYCIFNLAKRDTRCLLFHELKKCREIGGGTVMKKFLGLIISIIIYVVLTTPSFYAVISSDDETIKSFGWITQFISAVIICTVTKSWVYSVLEIEE